MALEPRRRSTKGPGRFAAPVLYTFGTMLDRLSRVAVAVVMAATVGWVTLGSALSPTRAADNTSDIPGIPLPGTVTTGPLGGPIYDVVFRLSVPAGSVIVASLTGTTGTDFDLYLFDSTATTVVSNTGLLTKSIGPTSTEAISWPSRTGGTFYIDLNGASDVLGTYTLMVQFVPDQTPPTLAIRLAGGHRAVDTTAIPVEVFAADDLSGVSEMAFSNDGETWGAWQPFAPTSTWQAPPGDGDKTLWARVRNGVGLVSAAAQATVTLDTVAPSVLSVSPPANSIVSGLRPTFTIQFGEPVNPATWAQYGLIVQSRAGALVAGTYGYDPSTRIGWFVPSTDLEAGAGYIVTVGPVTDLAGNRVASLGSWVVTPLAPSTVTLKASPGVLRLGEATVLTGQATGLGPAASLELSSRPASSDAPVAQSVPVPTDGRVQLTVRPAMNTTYRLGYAGTATIAPSQAEARVLVRRSVELAGLSSGAVRPVRRGTAVRLVAQIAPAAAGVSVSFRLYRYDGARRAFRYAGSWGRRTDAAGHASYTWVPASSGSYRWRVFVAPTPEYANNVSPIYRWTVR